MISLNLETKNNEQKRIKEYLEQNANETLADKINKGVTVTRDNKTLISKKDLNGCWTYCSEQAKKLLENKTSGGVYVSDDIVFGWAMHYFEEGSIVGKLYNTDGTEYKAPAPVQKPSTYTPPKQEPKPQLNMFDMLTEKTEPQQEEQNDEISEEDYEEATKALDEDLKQQNDEPDIDEITRRIDTELEKTKTASPIYKRYMEVQKQYPDHVVTLRLGDFYEIFGKNAITVANELDLTLTGRDCGLAERVPMVGFPYHVAEQYIGKIIAHGHKVAVIEKPNDAIELKEPIPEIIDKTTGEIITAKSDEILTSLFNLFGDSMEIRL